MARSPSSRIALLALALLLVFGAAAIWFALDQPSQALASADVPRATDDSPRRALDVAPNAPAAQPTVQVDEADDTQSQPSDERDTVASSGEDELATAQWVTGTVHLPESTPLGEGVEVVASGREFKHRDLHRAPIAADGSFRVAFSKSTTYGWLKIDAQHVYLDTPLKLKLSALPASIVLEPRLGGCIAGTLAVPEGEDDAALEGKSVALNGWSEGMTHGIQRSAKIESRSRFELRGIPANAECMLECDLGFWPPLRRQNLRVSPGETQTLELHFDLGARVSGRVLDDQGHGIGDATVQAEVMARLDGMRWNTARSAKVEPDGSFAVRGIPLGDVKLVATKKGLADARIELGELADRDVRDGVEVRMSLGHVLAGRVTWPDGRAAAGGRVAIDEPDSDANRAVFGLGPDHSVELAPDGSFRATGLGAGPFVVSASAEAEVEPGAGAEGSKRKKGAVSRVRVENVAADRVDLVLVLASGHSISGRVVDDLGLPVGRFFVRATHADEEHPWSADPANVVSKTFSPDDGAFELESLREGDWQVAVRAKGYWQGDPRVVHVPATETVELPLARAATLRGVVLDPDGHPLAKATVRAERDRNLRFAFSWNEPDLVDTTDSKGLFEIKNAPTGKLSLVAAHTEAANSEALAIEAGSGQTFEGLTLRLRKGARVTGELHASAGDPAGRTINVGPSSGGMSRSTSTDSSGRFEVAGLTPGDYQISADPSESELQKLSTGDEKQDWILRSSLTKSAKVTLAEGETKHVVLGAPPRAPVQVSGHVRRGSTGVAGVMVQAFPTDESMSRQQRVGTSDADGKYELVLDEPGTYYFGAQLSGTGTRTSRQEEVPEGASFTLDFELAGGRISGRTLGPDGTPLSGITVQLQPARATAESRSVATHGWMETGADGTFSFDFLPSGTYAVSASEMRWTGNGPSQRYGTAHAGGLELADNGRIENVELKLEFGGAIEGNVRTASGAPAVGAEIHLRDEHGELSRNSWGTRTDGTGHFRATGLAPGRWSVTARLDDESSEPSAPIEIASGDSEKVELVLRRGTFLRVTVQDSTGQHVGASLSVRDERGREYADLPTFARADGESAAPAGIGPLPPGTYTITASNHDGVHGSSQVSLHGEAEREVTVTMNTQ
jgi:uncharacterized GH25 family protein